MFPFYSFVWRAGAQTKRVVSRTTTFTKSAPQTIGANAQSIPGRILIAVDLIAFCCQKDIKKNTRWLFLDHFGPLRHQRMNSTE
jgi:hypothetical protein